jgi:hypothetical protein
MKNNYPEFVKIGDKSYKINTDFRVAIECNRIAEDNSIGDLERCLAIIYKLFGDEGLYDSKNHSKLLELALLYLSCGESKPKIDENPDMDLIEDEKYIKSSFKYDYQYNPYDMEYLHWYEFFNDLCNLSNSEFGACCILNRVRDLRNFDTSTIKDQKEKEKIEKAKEQVALKKYKKENNLTREQEESMERFNNILGI